MLTQYAHARVWEIVRAFVSIWNFTSICLYFEQSMGPPCDIPPEFTANAAESSQHPAAWSAPASPETTRKGGWFQFHSNQWLLNVFKGCTQSVMSPTFHDVWVFLRVSCVSFCGISGQALESTAKEVIGPEWKRCWKAFNKSKVSNDQRIQRMAKAFSIFSCMAATLNFGTHTRQEQASRREESSTQWHWVTRRLQNFRNSSCSVGTSALVATFSLSQRPQGGDLVVETSLALQPSIGLYTCSSWGSRHSQISQVVATM